MDQEIAERFKNVIDKGNKVLADRGIPRPGETNRVKDQPCLEWQSQSLALLHTVFGPDHTFTQNFESSTTAHGEPMPYVNFVQQGMGVLNAANEDFSKGWTWTFKEKLHADVFDDFLEMAEHLKNDGINEAAIVLAGGTLEEHLRQLSGKNNLPVENSAAKMNDALWKKGVYSKPTWRHLQGWYDLRTEAAHGTKRTHTDADVEDMIKGIRKFIDQYPA